VREAVAPPQGVGVKPSRGEAWCPYCGAVVRFVWDGELGVPRCPGCGISCRDFYVRKHSGLFDDAAMAAFERAVLGRKREGDLERARQAQKAPEAGIAPEPRASAEAPPADHEALPGHGIRCPACGARIRRGFYPVVRERCAGCGAVFDQGALDADPAVRQAGGLRCPECGQALGRAEPGVALMCPDCGAWAWAPGDRAAERAAKEAQAKARAPEAAAGEMRPGVLARAQALARRECAAFLPEDQAGPARCVYGGLCVFFGDGAAAARCGWFERAVLALDPELLADYCRRAALGERRGFGVGETPPEAGRAEPGLLENGGRVPEKEKRPWAVCGRQFVPTSNRQRRCSECSAEARRKAVSRAVARHRARATSCRT